LDSKVVCTSSKYYTKNIAHFEEILKLHNSFQSHGSTLKLSNFILVYSGPLKPIIYNKVQIKLHKLYKKLFIIQEISKRQKILTALRRTTFIWMTFWRGACRIKHHENIMYPLTYITQYHQLSVLRSATKVEKNSIQYLTYLCHTPYQVP
jgi:hypothetical protein